MSKEMKLRPRIFSGDGTEDPAWWIQAFERVARANGWNGHVEKIQSAVSCFTAEADKWVHAEHSWIDHPDTTWETFKDRLTLRFRSDRFNEKLEANLRSIKQGNQESVQTYAERFKSGVSLLPGAVYEAPPPLRTTTAEEGPSDGATPYASPQGSPQRTQEATKQVDRRLDAFKEYWVDGLRMPMRKDVRFQRPLSFSAALRYAKRSEDASDLVTHDATNAMGFQCAGTESSIDEIAQGLRELQLLVRTQKKDPPRDTSYVARAQGRPFPRDDRRPPGWVNENAYRQQRPPPVCYQCGKEGHIRARCPDLTEEQKDWYANRNRQEPSTSAPKQDQDSGESAAIHLAKRVRTEPGGATSGEPQEKKARRPRRKTVLQGEWKDHVRNNWTLPIGIMAGKSRREICQQSILAIRDALGRKMVDKVLRAGITGRRGGTVAGKRVRKIIIDCGATRTLINRRTAEECGLQYHKGTTVSLEMADGSCRTPYGVTDEEEVEVGGVVVRMRILVVEVDSSYQMLLGTDWMVKVDACGKWSTRTFKITHQGRWAVLSQVDDGCEEISRGTTRDGEEYDEEDMHLSPSSEEDDSESDSEEEERSAVHLALVVPTKMYDLKAGAGPTILGQDDESTAPTLVPIDPDYQSSDTDEGSLITRYGDNVPQAAKKVDDGLPFDEYRRVNDFASFLNGGVGVGTNVYGVSRWGGGSSDELNEQVSRSPECSSLFYSEVAKGDLEASRDRVQEFLRGRPNERERGEGTLERIHLIGEFDLEGMDIDPALTDCEKAQVKEVLWEHREVFATSLSDLAQTDLVTHRINLKPGARPHYNPGFKRFSRPEAEFIRAEVEKQLAAGVIRENDGPWCAPVTLGVKKGGAYRFCVAYIGLNAVTERESWPLPNLEEVLERLGGHSYYSTLDGFSGFNTVPISEEDQHMTQFRTPAGTYCYTVMPFGLRNAPHTYCRYVQKVFARGIGKSVETYLDDAAVYSEDFSGHLNALRSALQAAAEGSMRVNPRKCHFGYRGVEFLGHWVDGKGCSVMHDKVCRLNSWPPLKDVKDVRAFLGLCGYYRRFVAGYARLSEPLVRLTRKASEWVWGDEQEDAFKTLKGRLTTAPILQTPNYDTPWIVDCDASNTAVGAVLSQEDGDNAEHPVYFYSRLLTQAERNYSTTDRECLAVVAAAKKFRVYILGMPVKIRTDHTAVRQVLNRPDATGRYARWVCVLSEFDFTLTYRPGPRHGNADGLSRMHGPDPKAEDEPIDDEPRHFALMVRVQGDPWYSDVLEYLTSGSAPGETSKERYRVRNKAKRYTVKEGELMRLDCDGELKTCIRQDEVANTLQHFHDSEFGGHWGRDVTIETLRRTMYWPTMYRDVAEHVKKCQTCQSWRRSDAKGVYSPHDAVQPFELLFMDWVTNLPTTSRGNRCLVTCTDALTKWTDARAAPHASAAETARFFTDCVIARYGVPIAVATDNGSHFAGAFDEYLARIGVRHIHGTPYHPQSTGQAEKTNGLVVDRIRRFATTGGGEWDEYVQASVLAVNSRRSARMKLSPLEALTGVRPRNPAEIAVLRTDLENVEQRYCRASDESCVAKRLRILGAMQDEVSRLTREVNARLKEKYDHRAKRYGIRVGDNVMVARRETRIKHSKLKPRWKGPGIVTWVGEQGAYAVRIGGKDKLFNAVHVKPYFE